MPNHQSQVVITNLQHLRETIVYSRENGCEAEFAVAFVRTLSLITADAKDGEAEGKVTYGEVGKDFAPYSFRFHFGKLRPGQSPQDMGRGNGFQMNGGLIYHGPSDNGSGGFPALSVRLGRDPVKNPHEWSVHT